MEENLEPNNKATNEISDNATNPNSEEIKEPKSEVLDIKVNNSISQNNSDPKNDFKKDNFSSFVKKCAKIDPLRGVVLIKIAAR